MIITFLDTRLLDEHSISIATVAAMYGHVGVWESILGNPNTKKALAAFQAPEQLIVPDHWNGGEKPNPNDAYRNIAGKKFLSA